MKSRSGRLFVFSVLLIFLSACQLDFVGDCVVIYIDNGATSGTVPNDDTQYRRNDTVTVLGNSGNLAKTGCVFAGWNTAEDGSGTSYTEGQTFVITSSRVTLYAYWTQETPKHVFYDANGADGGAVPTDAADYFRGSTVIAAQNSGLIVSTWYTFGGWNTAPDGSGTTFALGQTFTMGDTDVTLYALWTINALYVSPSGSDSDPGTLGQPKATIQAAIDAAPSPTHTEIRVSQGTYNIGNEISLRNWIRLCGGYNDDFSARDWNAYPTTITDTRTSGGAEFAAVLCRDVQNVVIEGFVINGANTTSVNYTLGIEVSGTSTSVLIRHNTINGGVNTWGYTAAIYNLGTPDLGRIYEFNRINGGGNVSNNSMGLWILATCTVRYNTICGGGNNYYCSYSVLCEKTDGVDCYPRFSNNLIIGGYAGTCDECCVRLNGNNISTSGMMPEFYNNTMVAPEGSSADYCVYARLCGAGSFVNNIMYSKSDNVVNVYDINGWPLGAFENNCLFSEGIYVFDAGVATTCSGNIFLDPRFASLGGADGSISTPADNDWRLSAFTDPSITGGGLDLSSIFTDDFAGTPRTSPWSMGAFEY